MRNNIASLHNLEVNTILQIPNLSDFEVPNKMNKWKENFGLEILNSAILPEIQWRRK